MRIRFNVFKKVLAFICAMSAIPAFAVDNWQMNMPKGVTSISRDIYHLHMIAMGVCALIGIGVFGVLIYSLIHHRKSKGHSAASFHDNLKVEIIWTIVPFFILVLLAIPATIVLVHMDDTSNADITVKVTGYQWKWRYEYLDHGISFFSNLSTPQAQISNEEKKGQWYLLEVDKPLVVPIHQKIRFLVTANDVIHSWWVPALGVKRDAIPGFMHEAWARIDKPGTYRGQCAELCGLHHGYMPIVVKALPIKAFNEWAAKQEKVKPKGIPQPDLSSDELMKLGKTVYDTNCAACHKLDGTGTPPVFPALKNSSVAVGKPISRHINTVLHGITGTAMQAFASQLSDKDLAAVVTYERNAWGNNTMDVVQPSFVQAVRNGDDIKPTMKKKNAGGNN